MKLINITEELQGMIDEGICIRCGGDDVECLEDCTKHRCTDCEYIPEQDYSTLKDIIDSTGG